MISSIDGSKCSGCGICVDICNMDVLRQNTTDSKAYIAYKEDCMTCFECHLQCPESAIYVNFSPECIPDTIEIPARR
jgi:NAD-dependent dihydropyrimidine dehydrogenase PreA subunit